MSILLGAYSERSHPQIKFFLKKSNNTKLYLPDSEQEEYNTVLSTAF